MQSRRSVGWLIYPRHFVALVVAAILLIALHAYRPRDALVATAVYGALYSAITALTMRDRYPIVRMLSFIAAAAALNCLSFFIIYHGGRRLGWSSPLDYLVMCAGAGALVYALLLRRLFMPQLAPRALVLLPLVSVLAVVGVFVSGLYSRSIDALAVGWWFAFSGGLWCEDRRNARAAPA